MWSQLFHLSQPCVVLLLQQLVALMEVSLKKRVIQDGTSTDSHFLKFSAKRVIYSIFKWKVGVRNL